MKCGFIRRLGRLLEDSLQQNDFKRAGRGLQFGLPRLFNSLLSAHLSAAGEYLRLCRSPSLLLVPAIIAIAVISMSSSYAATDATTSSPGPEKIIKALENDSFETIANREFGAKGLGRQLAEYNALPYETIFTAGLEVRIPISFEPKKDAAEFVYVKGEVLLYTAANSDLPSKAEVASKVYVDDRIKTGETGFASLQFSTGSIVNIQPLSDVVLSQLNCLDTDEICVVNLDAKVGGVSADVKRRSQQPVQFNIDTPYASAAVRGTVFDFDTNEGKLLVGVTEGDVVISTNTGSLDLPAGLGVKTAEGQPPGAPVRLLPSPRFKGVAARTTSEDMIAWSASPLATNYLLSMSLQAGGSEEQYREKSEDAEHYIRSLPGGEYFINVRALDATGFKGFTASRKLNVVNLNRSVDGPALMLSRQSGDHYVSLQQGGEESTGDSDSTLDTLYEFQFSHSPDFADSVSVDVPQNGGAIANFSSNEYYARARTLLAEDEVSKFGPVLRLAAD